MEGVLLQSVGIVVNTRCFRVLCAAVLLTGFALPAHADLIVVDPNAYPVGTDLSTMFDDLTMARLTNQPNHDGSGGSEAYDPIAAPVLAMATYHTDGANSLGGTAWNVEIYEACVRGTILGCGYNVLELRFDNPTNFVQIDSLGFSDGPALLAYDILGNRIDPSTWFGPYTGLTSATLLPDSRTAFTQTLTSGQANIARIVYGGFNGTTTAVRVSYNVPEPATLSLIGMGLFGAALLRKRRRSASSR